MKTNGNKARTHAFWRVKQLREMMGVTLEELAERTGFTKSYLSKVERGLSVPSVATALKLADAFEISVGDLFGVSASDKDYVVVRKDERKPFVPKGRRTTRLQVITPGLAKGLLEAFIHHPPHERLPEEKRVQHKGQEMVFVLKGRMEMSFPHSSVSLSAGDCMVFNGRLPHYTLSVGKQRAEALVVIVATDSDVQGGPPGRRGALE